jgi:DNA-binding PadR family transcriptional regulator
MIDLTPPQFSILDLLSHQPWFTPHQLSLWFRHSKTRIYSDLECLLAQRLVQRLNPRSASLANRAVYALTDRGVRALAESANVEPKVLRVSRQLSRARHIQLLWVIERVCRVRDLMLELERDNQGLSGVAVEVEERVFEQGQEHVLHLHGRGMLRGGGEQMLPFVVEWELEEGPITIRRLTDFVLWQHAPRFLGEEGESYYPQLLFVVPRFERISELYRVLVQICVRNGMTPLPPAFFTTAEWLKQRGVHAPIWFSIYADHWGAVFDGVSAMPTSVRVFSPVSTRPEHRSGTIGTFRAKAIEDQPARSSTDLLQFKLQLAPQAKRVLQEVAVHPLLTAEELAFLRNADPERVEREVKQLAQWELIRAYAKKGRCYYTLAILGLRYLTAAAGYGRAVRAYARQRGLRGGTRRLLFHFQHTRVTNAFFLGWMRLAREQGATFRWDSELASQRYFREQDQRYRGGTFRLHSFLPDGSGVWERNGEWFRSVVEIDRTHESMKNLIAKFGEYYAWQQWREREWRDRRVVHVLVVTTGWKRSQTIREANERACPSGAMPLVLWVTTFGAIGQSGMDAPIWRSTEQRQERLRLPCFVKPRPEQGVALGTAHDDDFQD